MSQACTGASTSQVPIVDVFPTVEEISDATLGHQCDVCDKQFMNPSMCRFHRVKCHGSLDKAIGTEKRILDRFSEKEISYRYYCPMPNCIEKNVKFEGMKDLRQHYSRVHTEKKYACENCGIRSALEKDIKYHKKYRCRAMKTVQ
ncbi:unnamed protein product [Caenorhabditis bovis]|uniref:C2H2-type domain-containing protein n=1 Tax=Caenorhabditis bovis TaxID=2654633 RepID=A0A8S1F5T4_9PELO|nr:unnamed protein product [Caenorhabditis bovis]